MKEKNILLFDIVIFALITGFLFIFPLALDADAAAADNLPLEEIEKHIKEIMEEGKIPGAVVVLIQGDEQVMVNGYGYADLESQTPVTPDTLFELGSCSKSFTALAVLQLAKDEFVELDDPVSKYFPWFKVTFRDQEYKITINHLLHHTSGIPWRSFAAIPRGDSKDALAAVVRQVSGTELKQVPGREFRYSNTNYDILGAIIEAASGMTFENYMAKKVFAPLGMTDTSVGLPVEGLPMSTGYKISFGTAQALESPVYRGNWPAGYVISNGKDMAKWLKVQLGLVDTEFKSIIENSHKPDPLLQGNMYRPILYSMGWRVRSGTNKDIFHGGLNPNFAAQVVFNPIDKLAVAVLANSNSFGTGFLGGRLMELMAAGEISEEELEEYDYQGGLDSAFSVASYVLGILLIIVLAIMLSIGIGTIRNVRHFEAFNLKKLYSMGVALFGTIPFALGIYFFPYAAAGISWQGAIAWAPGSFPVAIALLLSFLGASNILFLLSLILPYKNQTSFRNKYIKPLPLVLFLGFISGLASSAAIFLISTSFFSPLELKYLLYYLGMVIFISVLGQKIVRTKMIVIANDIVYELRMKLIGKIFATRYQKFEKIDSGRVYATINNDTETIANSAGMVVSTITSFVTAIAAFVYLSAISFLATMATLLFALLLGGFYIIVGKTARVLMEQMRDTQNVFMKLIEGLVKGFREISMHHNKKVEYEMDVEKSCDEYRRTRVSSIVKFVNANLVSSSMILFLLAAICISFPRLFPDMSLGRLISYIMVLLYMIGPVTGIMSSFPTFIRIKVSWDRIQKFIAEIPAIEELSHYKDIKTLSHKGKTVESIEAKGITFEYKGKDESESFCVGPIDLKVNKGEILFLVGGNGSGKTTLAKLITGLYQPEEGTITIDGKKIAGDDYLGEYYSAIFDDFQLFEKLYNVDINEKNTEIEEYLGILQMKGKVELKDGRFSTIDLSSGQRKRLALLQCWLEDCPIYLFDEVAADQDPEFRKFFYRDLLMRMKEEGKIVICITHDDHYFDVADKIIKMDMGKIDTRILPPAAQEVVV